MQILFSSAEIKEIGETLWESWQDGNDDESLNEKKLTFINEISDTIVTILNHIFDDDRLICRLTELVEKNNLRLVNRHIKQKVRKLSIVGSDIIYSKEMGINVIDEIATVFTRIMAILARYKDDIVNIRVSNDFSYFTVDLNLPKLIKNLSY